MRNLTPAYESPKIARAYLTSFREQQKKWLKYLTTILEGGAK